MHSLKMDDPTGPGTPAWDAYGKALRAYHQTEKGQHGPKNKTYKQYLNFRQYMIAELRKHNASVDEWLAALRRDCQDPELKQRVLSGDY